MATNRAHSRVRLNTGLHITTNLQASEVADLINGDDAVVVIPDVTRGGKDTWVSVAHVNLVEDLGSQ